MTTKTVKTIEKLAGTQLSFGRVLWAIRVSDDLTQEAFAAELGVSKQYLSALENDRKIVSVKQAQKFALILGQSEKLFVKYALQDLLNKYHVDYQVDLHKAA
ncbi:MAG: helix-turn-helix transcriptional regulator [Coxiellaceae bacterium]|nr:helix-turn-helix transcriptional regulator [Coxiellaceae bacterium]